jgi:toxin ParE1/3/4
VACLALSRRALLDLDTIEGYSVEKWGRDVADQYMTMIEQALELLREQPGLLRAKPEVSESLVFYRVRRHFLVCTLEEQNVYVLAVINGSMDLPERISELEPTLQREADILHRAFLASRRR